MAIQPAAALAGGLVIVACNAGKAFESDSVSINSPSY
jgi:hypothetical protein